MSNNRNENDISNTSWANLQNSYTIDPSSIVMTNTATPVATEGRHGHGVYNNIHHHGDILYSTDISGNSIMYQQQQQQLQSNTQQQQQQQQQPERYSVLPVGHGNFLKVYHTHTHHGGNEQQSFNNYELFSNNSFISTNSINKPSLSSVVQQSAATTVAATATPSCPNINYEGIKKSYNNDNENTTNMIINQLVTNWSPNLSGTYSPFGEQQQKQNQQHLQQQQQQQLQDQQQQSLNVAINHHRNFITNSNVIKLNETMNQNQDQSNHPNSYNQQHSNLTKNQQFSSTSSSSLSSTSKTNGSFEKSISTTNTSNNNSNSGQNFEVKKRIIAEVKPMRMSYSDVLSKNVNTNNNSNSNSNNNNNNNNNNNGNKTNMTTNGNLMNSTTATTIQNNSINNTTNSESINIQSRNKNMNEKNNKIAAGLLINEKKSTQLIEDKEKYDINKQQRKYNENQYIQKNDENTSVQQQHFSVKDKKNYKDDSQWKNKKSGFGSITATTKLKQKNVHALNTENNTTANNKKRFNKRDIEDDERINSSQTRNSLNHSEKENLYNITKNDYSNNSSEKKSSNFMNNSTKSSKSAKYQSNSIFKNLNNNPNNGNNISGNNSSNNTNNNNSNSNNSGNNSNTSGRFDRQLYSSSSSSLSSSKRNYQKHHNKNVKYDLISKFFDKWLEYTMKIILWLFYLIYDIIVLGCSMLYERLLTFYGLLHSYVITIRNDFKNNSCKLWIKNLFKKFDNKFKKNSKLAFWRRFYKKKPQEQLNDFYKNGRLPQTGDEAMYSLLNCKGKDAYSILGVTADSSQEQIRKHYKKIAVLVHPDKNKQPGAEEAFKVLQRAFELIGEPENRKKYDQSLAEALNAEKAWTELHDLLSQLQSKIAEAANTIRCSSCGLRHPRKLTERPHYAARECSTCKIRHSAREGDIWAETSIFGLRWKYLALMEGKVYDITEWANCQKGALSQLQPNSHVVQYRIVRGGQQQQQQQQTSQQDREKLKKEIPTEPSLDEFLDNLYSGQNPQNQQNSSRRRTKRN